MTQPYKVSSDELLRLITEGIQERKGKHITHIDLSRNESSAASNFVICEGSSPIQVSAIADSIRDYLLENAGIKPYNYDGYTNSQWIVIDYGDILVHVFLPSERSRYNLEELWSDAVITEIPDID
ncbi:MAG: ribosome silencing factor [Paramuribaculum sp.]|nr:ribosome silencing factor [Paramuribaculum sp.]